ncbi:MAG: hypothetical protein KFH87_14975, partial [Bacteroidetes bacterium]|nr:hypothetical protein [Bacteroidota bacterium]
PPPPPPALTASIQAFGVYEHDIERPIATMRVEEFISTEMRPLLHYVFFSEGSDELPERYARLQPAETDDFSVQTLMPLDNLKTYHHVLNIIGSRMRQYPDATLRLVGTNSDEGQERGDDALSRQRAVTVRDYLTRVWSIAEERLRIEYRGLPEKPSNITVVDGIEENRRVELYPSIPEIIDPIIIDDTLRTVNPPHVRFRPNVVSDAGVTEWSLEVEQSTLPLKSFDGRGDVPGRLDWRVQQDRMSIPRGDTPLQYRLSVTDAAAQQVETTPGLLPVEQLTVQRKRIERLGDKEIDRYNLILFDFNSEELGARNLRIVDMIKPRISAESTVNITGYTDRIGEMRVNQPLSEGRARSAARALNVPLENAIGLGATDMYTNELPEGRFYCRTVTIVVETPVE